MLLPQGGVDHGDHPPITPVRSASEAEVGGGDAWRLYDYVSRHFLGSISPDATFRKTVASFSAGGEQFSAAGVMPLRPGFTAVMPWKVRDFTLIMHSYPVTVFLAASNGHPGSFANHKSLI